MNNLSRQYQGIPAAVFGSTGFIGRWVARGLCQAGANLFLPVRDKLTAHRIGQEYKIHGKISELDYRDEKAVRKFIGQTRPAIIFNLSGYGIDRSEQCPETAYSINSRLVEIICESISETKNFEKWSGQKIIHAGTAMEYGSIPGDLDEGSVPRPTTLYGRSKLAGTENLTKFLDENKIRGLTARLFAVYGPGELPQRLLPTLIRLKDSDEPIEFTAGRHKRDFVHVEDVARGLLLLGAQSGSKDRIVNLATGKLTSIRNFIKISAKVLGIAEKRLSFGALPTRPEEMKHEPVTNRRLSDLTGWTPGISIREGVERTLLFYKK